MSADNVVILPGAEADLTAGQAEVRALLERRNLSLAADRCGLLLQAYPEDPVAHALMGDIYAARQLWAEAVEWYTLAENLGGGREASRRRAAAQAMLPRALPRPEPAAEPFDFQRQRTRVLAISVAAGAVLIIAVVIALLALSSGSPTAGGGARPESAPYTNPARPESAPSRAAPAGGGGVAAESAIPGPVAAAPTPSTGAPAPSPAPPPPSHVPVIITRRMEVPATDEDYIISRAVSTLTWPDGTPMSGDVSVMADPYQGYCMVTFRIPQNLPGNFLEDTVTLQAYQVINATFDTDAAMSAVTVRAIATISTSRHDHTTLEAMRANLSRQARDEWRKTLPNPTAADLRDKIFSTTFWWNPAVPKDQLR